MEDLEQSSLEEKVDLGNLVLFPPDSCVNKETGEDNFRIKDEPSEIKINDEISDNSNIKKETIELLVDQYEIEPIEFYNNGNEMCQFCGIEFGNKTVLKIHTSTVHPKEEKHMKDKIRLNKHQSIPKSTKHNCDLCIFQSANKRSLERHIETIHDGKKRHQCSLCDASYNNKSLLDGHVQVVHEGKKFECTLCNKGKYNQKRNLNLHIRTVHEGMGKKHPCTICSYRFSSSASLRRHVESVHEGKKPFRCDICDAKFALKSTLDSHIRNIHENPKHIDETKKAFHCNSCPASFVKIET